MIIINYFIMNISARNWYKMIRKANIKKNEI